MTGNKETIDKELNEMKISLCDKIKEKIENRFQVNEIAKAAKIFFPENWPQV